MDCHENTPYFHGMTATATTKTKRMKNNQDAVTANPLGCGSLWNNKQQQRQRLDCHGNKLPRNDDKGKRRKANGKEENGFIFYVFP